LLLDLVEASSGVAEQGESIEPTAPLPEPTHAPPRTEIAESAAIQSVVDEAPPTTAVEAADEIVRRTFMGKLWPHQREPGTAEEEAPAKAVAGPEPTESEEAPQPSAAFPEDIWGVQDSPDAPEPLLDLPAEEPPAARKPRSWWRRGWREATVTEGHAVQEEAETALEPPAAADALADQVPPPLTEQDAPAPEYPPPKRRVRRAPQPEPEPEPVVAQAPAPQPEPEPEPVVAQAPAPWPSPAHPDDPSLVREAAIREMLDIGDTFTKSSPTATQGSRARSPEFFTEEPRRSKLPWKRGKRKRGKGDSLTPPGVTRGGSSALAYETAVGVAGVSGGRYEIPAVSPSTNGSPAQVPAQVLCSRCGQPTSGGGLCEACEDALSQLRQLTAAILQDE
jgi:hypothetical protein